jgi:hypothetical protein
VLALSHTDPQGAATRFHELLREGGTVGGLQLQQGEHDVQELEDVQLPLSGRCKKWLAAAGGTDARSAARKAAKADPVSTLFSLVSLLLLHAVLLYCYTTAAGTECMGLYAGC